MLVGLRAVARDARTAVCTARAVVRAVHTVVGAVRAVRAARAVLYNTE